MPRPALMVLLFGVMLGGPAQAEAPDPYFEWLKQQQGTQQSPQATQPQQQQPQQQQQAPAPAPAPSTSRHAQVVDFGDFVTVYLPTTNYGALQGELRKTRFLESWTDGLNELIALSSNVQIAYGECNTPNAFYSPETRRITICYELITYYYQLVNGMDLTQEQKNSAFASMIVFVFFHELGHALIDVLDLSFTGREEDAADQLSTYLMLATGGESMSPIYFAAQQYLSRPAMSEQVYADEHAFGPQRFYNIVCWVYGSRQLGQQAEAELEGYLPPGRKAKCPGEFRKLMNGWESLLAPYVKE